MDPVRHILNMAVTACAAGLQPKLAQRLVKDQFLGGDLELFKNTEPPRFVTMPCFRKWQVFPLKQMPLESRYQCNHEANCEAAIFCPCKVITFGALVTAAEKGQLWQDAISLLDASILEGAFQYPQNEQFWLSFQLEDGKTNPMALLFARH